MTAPSATLTPRLRAVWRELDARRRRGESAPSYTEIMAATGITTKYTVYLQMRRLERLGIIRQAPGRSRAITLLEPYCWFED